MDPALEEAVRRGPADREIEAAALVSAGVPLPADLRVVAAFRDVVTGRVRLDQVAEVRRHRAILSLKAPRAVGPADAILEEGPPAPAPPPRGVEGATGAGCVLAFLDWGCDFAHPNFRGESGGTRLRAIWDQRGPGDGNRWGYGRVLDRARIDEALRQPDPYAALGYHPGHRAAHGTHVMDIAAGNGRLPGSARGVAPDAELVFIQLATGLRTGECHLGDSVRLLEALDCARVLAGDDPLVVNMSLGRTAGDHTGSSLVERGMDAFLEEAPGRCICQSTGNYFGKRLHAAGTLSPGQAHTLDWIIEPNDRTSNELEIWYPGSDRLSVEIAGPGGAAPVRVRLGERAPIGGHGKLVGFAYNRECDPLNGDHHVDVFLEPDAPHGTWEVRLLAEDVVDGRWHAWIERDPAGPDFQSRFRADVATDDSTIGSIATARRTLAVGAVDPGTGLPAPFSARGPCRDGRPKPDLAAYGVGIVAACSTPPGAAPGSGGLVEMSGTSMASPHVAGTVAALFGLSPRPLNVAETRLLVLGTATRLEGDPMRTGAGLLDTEAALAALDCMFRERKGAMSRQNGRSGEPQSQWSNVGSEEFEREMEAVLGSVDAYDVVGWPGGALRAPIRAGDVLVRVDGGSGGRALVARMAAPGLHGADVLPPGAEAEGDGDGQYAEALERTPAGWARAPAFRIVANRQGVVEPRQIVLRPASGALRPQILFPPPRPAAVAPVPIPAAPPPAAAMDEPASPEPSPPDDDTGVDGGDEREDAPAARGKQGTKPTAIDFSDEPAQITVPVAQIDSTSPEQEVEVALATLRAWMRELTDSYGRGLASFETEMVFASDQEARPQYLDVALKEIAKAIVEAGLKHALEGVPVVGEIVGAAKAIVVGWYEEKERASKARGDRRIAEYIVDVRNQIDELSKALQGAVDTARPKLLAQFRAALASSAPGQGKYERRLTGDLAQLVGQLRRTVAGLRDAVPSAARVQQLLTEKFMGPPRLTDYISHGGRQSATLFLNVSVYHDRSAAPPWKVKKVDAAWTIPSLSPRPDRLASSLKSAMRAQRDTPVWRCNLAKAVHLQIEEEVRGPNEYYEGYVWFHDDPSTFTVGGVYGERPFREAWSVPEIRAAALAVNDLVGSKR